MGKQLNTTQLTQGRVVRYVQQMMGPARIVWPAMVTLTDGRSKCTLAVFTARTVLFVDDAERDDKGAVGTWHWPGALGEE